MNRLLSFLKKQFHLKILKRKYYRYGKCNMCGGCCENIYVRHKNTIIQNEEEFIEIKKEDKCTFYKHINIIGKDDFGLIFACQKYDKEKKLCTNHKSRPKICSNYPSEEIFMMGACLKEDCGYRFEPIEKFEEVFKKISKKPVKNFEQL